MEEEQDSKPAAVDNDVLLTQQLRNGSGYLSGNDGFPIGEVQESLRRSVEESDGFDMNEVQELIQRSLDDTTSVETDFPRYNHYSNNPTTAVSTSSNHYHSTDTDTNTNTLGMNIPAAAVSTSSHTTDSTRGTKKDPIDIDSGDDSASRTTKKLRVTQSSTKTSQVMVNDLVAWSDNSVHPPDVDITNEETCRMCNNLS